VVTNTVFLESGSPWQKMFI